MKTFPRLSLLALFATFLAAPVQADWHLQWSHFLPEREANWQHVQRMSGDSGYEPAVAGGLAFVGCEHNGAVIALDTETGEESWRYYTAAPIRIPPVADRERVYVGSSDGYLYALDHTGKLAWKLRGGPSDRMILGHGRMISAWPITTEPLLADGTLYFTAGYWPVDGIYVHAVDAATGEIKWTNNAAEFRPNRAISLVDGKLMIDGDNSSAVLDAAAGSILNEKRIKPPPKKRPEVSGIKGNMTGWAEDGETLIVGTTAGLFGFARSKNESPREHGQRLATPFNVDNKRALGMMIDTGVTAGFCLIAGVESGSFVEALLKNSDLNVVAIDPDASKVERLRREFDAHGLFDSHRLALLTGNADSVVLPPYFADLIVSETDDDLAKSFRESLRPYGGTLVLDNTPNRKRQLVRRSGSLPGAADWTHEFQNAANTLASSDTLVKAPLGLLWYGGEAGDARFYFDGNVDHQSGHGLNPQPVPAQIIEGRMILQGPGLLGAIDIYTGRVLWESPLPTMYTFGGGGGGLGIHSKKHPRPWEQPEAMDFDVTPTERCRASGFNMVSQPDGIYVGAARKLLRFDPKTGDRVSAWDVPLEGDLRWGNLRVADELLIATLFHPQDLADAQAGHDGNGGDWSGDRMPMKYLVAIDRQSGELKWQREAQWGFLNRSGICAGDGKVFCVDLITEKIHAKWNEAGRKFPEVPPTLYALDLKTGKELWQFPLDVYVQNIVYSTEHDLLLAPCRNLKEWRGGKWHDLSIDIRRGTRNKNSTGKMRALKGSTGEIVWEVAEAAYHSPHIVLGDVIIDRWGHSYDLLTGERHLRISPLTGEKEMWSFRKGGCNHLVACENMVTWRCAYYDLANYSGTKTLTGMDAGCAPTLLPAGGILNVANFGTHHKRNRMTAMALVHRPENELWTSYATSREKIPAGNRPAWIDHAGFNFGAAGDHVDQAGNLWLGVNARQRGNVSYQPKEVEWFNLGSSVNDSLIASSAILGAESITIPLTPSGDVPKGESITYTVRLHFARPATAETSDRLFSIALEGKTVLEKCDLSEEVKEFRGIVTDGRLDIALTAIKGQTILSGVELIREK